MPSTNLGKVKLTPKGDYNPATQYEVLDIVSNAGGSYVALKDVLGVTPNNDGINWQQLSGPGTPGGFGTVTATVDDTSGTPDVEVNTDGPNDAINIEFAFTGLRGAQGVPGKPAIIRDGTWWQWDEDSQKYVDTGETANGNVLYATFEIDPDTMELVEHTSDGYNGPTFCLNNGYLEVTVNG